MQRGERIVTTSLPPPLRHYTYSNQPINTRTLCNGRSATYYPLSCSSARHYSSARSNAAKQGRKGIAHKYQLGVIMPVFRAYAAAVVSIWSFSYACSLVLSSHPQLCFPLSSEAHFNDTGGTFNYIDFTTKFDAISNLRSIRRLTRSFLLGGISALPDLNSPFAERI
ncbi:unnamed protein product [Rhizoctonia solani]|nr:unnamed protein product [Rhizoctonia solani]